MKDKLEDIERAVDNAPRCPDYWPMDELEWLISEVRRLRWFEVALHHVLGGGACPWCLGEEAHHEETHKPGCEYIAHKERA